MVFIKGTGAWEIVRMPVAKASREKFPEASVALQLRGPKPVG